MVSVSGLGAVNTVNDNSTNDDRGRRAGSTHVGENMTFHINPSRTRPSQMQVDGQVTDGLHSVQGRASPSGQAVVYKTLRLMLIVGNVILVAMFWGLTAIRVKDLTRTTADSKLLKTEDILRRDITLAE